MAEETHVAVSHEAEPAAAEAAVQDTAAAAVATAGAAVALANETAAHAELQAAEEVAEVASEVDEWRQQTSEAVSSLTANLLTVNERLETLSALEQERHSRDEMLSARLAEIEAHPTFQKSIPPASEAQIEETTGQVSETEPASLVGAEASANVGPAEVAGGASLQNPSETSQSPGKKRRWI